MLWYTKLVAKRYAPRIALGCVLATGCFVVRSRAAGLAPPRELTAEERIAAEYAAQAADLGRRMADARSASAAMDDARRLRAARRCAEAPRCSQWEIDAMVEGAPPEAQPRTMRVIFAAIVEDAARNGGADGDDGAATARRVAGLVARTGMGFALLDEMPSTPLPTAATAPRKLAGRTVRLTGRIVAMRFAGAAVEGELLSETKAGGTSVRFVTTMSTKGLRAGAPVTYRGVVIPSDEGALVLAGAFELPENR